MRYFKSRLGWTVKSEVMSELWTLLHTRKKTRFLTSRYKGLLSVTSHWGYFGLGEMRVFRTWRNGGGGISTGWLTGPKYPQIDQVRNTLKSACRNTPPPPFRQVRNTLISPSLKYPQIGRSKYPPPPHFAKSEIPSFRQFSDIFQYTHETSCFAIQRSFLRKTNKKGATAKFSKSS